MRRSGHTFRVFISSTFSDMSAEREALRSFVYPRLVQFCAARGARFQPVDLRWGISAQAAQSQQVLDICLQEVRRCLATHRRPNFVALLGDRYGARLPYARLLADVYSRLRSATEDHPDRELWQRWYLRDANACPEVHVLAPRVGGYVDKTTWAQEEVRLLGLFQAAAERDPALAHYCASATELSSNTKRRSERCCAAPTRLKVI